jgi:hypothetical protein
MTAPDIGVCGAHVRYWPKADMPKNAINVAMSAVQGLSHCVTAAGRDTGVSGHACRAPGGRSFGCRSRPIRSA